jgi:hypothetical protein
VTEQHYNSLFIEGDMFTLQQFRSHFSGAEFGAETHTLCYQHVGDEGDRKLMYSFRTVTPSNLEALEQVSARYRGAKLVLLHDTLGRRPFRGFAVVEQGRLTRYGGAIVGGLTMTSQSSLQDEILHKRYGRHRISWETFERRMRANGVEPDDPIEGPQPEGDGIDW